MITLLLLGASLIFSQLSGQILEQAQQNYRLISIAISGAVGTAFVCRLALYMAMGQGGSKYAKLFRETLEYYTLTAAFPFLLSTIIDTANSVAQAMVPKMDFASKAQLERELLFPGILSSIMLKMKWWGMSLSLLLSHISHGIHVGLIYILYGLAPIFIFSHTMFNFTLAFPVLLGFVTVLSLWPVAASICSIMGDGVFRLAHANSGDMKSVLVLFAAYVGISILNLIIPFLLFFLASGHGPVSSFKLLKGLGGKAWDNTTSLAKNSVRAMKALPELPSRVSQGWRDFKTNGRDLMSRGSDTWSNFKGGLQAGVSHAIGSNPEHHRASRGVMEFPSQLASGIRAFGAFQRIGRESQGGPHASYLSHATRMTYQQHPTQGQSEGFPASSAMESYDREYPSLSEDSSYSGLKVTLPQSEEGQRLETKAPAQTDYTRNYGSNSKNSYSGLEIYKFTGSSSPSIGKKDL